VLATSRVGSSSEGTSTSQQQQWHQQQPPPCHTHWHHPQDAT
jgi:hypothetical protein